MVVDVIANVFTVIPEKKREDNFLNKISDIVPFMKADDVYTAPLDYIYTFKALALKNKMTEWVRKSGFIEWTKTIDKDAIEIQCGVNNSRIIWNKNIPKAVEAEIDRRCSYFVMSAVNTTAYKRKIWDGYVHLYSTTSKRFSTGVLHLVEDVLIRNKVPYIKYNMFNSRPNRQFNWIANDKIIPEEDQELAVNMAYQFGRGVIKAPTGFGKTAVLAVRTTAKFGVPTLFLANKKTLLDDAKGAFIGLIDNLDETKVHQIKDGTFGDIKIKKTTTADEIPNLDSHIIVATIQSLNSRLNDPRTKDKLLDWLQNKCKMFMIDECQAINDKQWKNVLDKCKAPYRFALSATPRRSDGATLLIHSQTGDTIFWTSAEEQIAKGRLCELDIQYHAFDHMLFNENDADIVYAEAYKEWIVHNEKRNNFLVEKTFELVNEQRLTLLLINSIEHGEVLKEALIKSGLSENDVRFVYGESKDKVRQAAIDEFRKGEFKVLIGSTIFDAGVNIPAISGVIIAGAGNSEITLIQKIGRGARTVDFEKELGYIPEFMKNADQKITKVIDVLDKNVKFFTKQGYNRYKNASEEFGKSRVKIMGTYTKISNVAKEHHKMTTDEVTNEQINLLNKFASKKRNTQELDVEMNDSQKSLIDMFIND